MKNQVSRFQMTFLHQREPGPKATEMVAILSQGTKESKPLAKKHKDKENSDIMK